MKPALAVLLGALATTAGAQEFSFDASEFEKKPFEFGGYIEAKQEMLRTRPDSVGYRLAYPDEAARDSLNRSTATLELNGKWNAGSLTADFRSRSSLSGDEFERSQEPGTLLDGGLRWSLGESLLLDAGKRAVRWGKGYAWNPVGFIERAKDPNDTQLSREGYYMSSAEWVKSFDAPLKTLSLTAYYLPQKGDLNQDFGLQEQHNAALKSYALLYDTDIDAYWLSDGSRPARFGFDFSRNLGASIEIHGEWARSLNTPSNLLNADGSVSRSQGHVDSYLIGTRYISESLVTWVAEYYHNGAGYSEDELETFYRFADTALAPGASAQQAQKARSLAQSGYARSNPGQDYLYLRASKPEPFGWLYTSVALTSIMNLQDHSLQITPEFSYTGIQDLELRTRAVFLHGDRSQEFGQKTAGRRFEVYARYSF